jgi:transcriptional regulator with XRE-family HTH domain
MKFQKWVNQKYKLWAINKVKGEDTVENFANYIGVSQQLMSFWLNGKRMPGARTIPLLAKKYGQEIYDTLGHPSVESDSPFDQLPTPFKERLEAATSEINARYQQEGVNPETDSDGAKALEIAREVFDKFDIDINISEADDDGA